MKSRVAELLAARATSKVPDSRIVTADEVADWPARTLDKLLQEGVLEEIQPAPSVECDACNDGHSALVEFIDDRAYISCPESGLVAVDPQRMRRWRIVTAPAAGDFPAAPAEKADNRIPGVFDFIDGYRWVKLCDREFHLTERQGSVVGFLHEAYLSGRPDRTWPQIASKIENAGTSMSQTFKGVSGWQQLITRTGRDLYRLNLPAV